MPIAVDAGFRPLRWRLTRRVICLTLALALCSCSALEVRERMATGTAAAAPAAQARSTQTAWPATEQAWALQARSAAATIAALETIAARPSPASSPQLAPLSSAEALVFGSLPLDSDRLNTIAALAFDQDGHLLVATRAGEIYRLPDSDGDDRADESALIFADVDEALRQVAGLLMRGDRLIALHGGRLSQLHDDDGDGVYDRASALADELPMPVTPLLASNSLVQAPDGRLFSADLSQGEILLIR